MSKPQPKLTPSGLAALMSARICHDLISPVGALNTALEILSDKDNTDMHKDAMDLIQHSANQATSKLKFLRLAFGAGQSTPGELSLDDVKSLVHDLYAGGKVNYEWHASIHGIDKRYARLLLNLIMIATQSIPRGGEMKISLERQESGISMRLVSQGPKARLDDMFMHTINGRAPEDGFDGRSIQPFYTGMLAREMSFSISADITDDIVTYNALQTSAKKDSSAAA